MTEPRRINTWDTWIAYLIDLGWADDEILDDAEQVARRDKRGQNVMFTEAGELIDFGSLRGRRQVVALLAAIRGDVPVGTPSVPAGITPDARRLVPTIPAQVSYLRRTTGRVTKSNLANRLGIHRDTLAEWITKGWVEWPPA